MVTGNRGRWEGLPSSVTWRCDRGRVGLAMKKGGIMLVGRFRGAEGFTLRGIRGGEGQREGFNIKWEIMRRERKSL